MSRYYMNKNTIIDLDEVVAIVVNGRCSVPSTGEVGYQYKVLFRNGNSIECIGYDLNKQFKEYKGLTDNEN